MKSLLTFLMVSSITCSITVFIGLLLSLGPDWHFTIADIAEDVGVAFLFGALSVPAVSA